MAIISLTIIDSSVQIVSGIPITISVSSNIPATIFYTLDGTVPTTFSNIYAGPIVTPTNSLSVILNVFATNGVDTSAIMTKTYETNILNDARLPHAPVTNVNNSSTINSLFPFGTNSPEPNFQYLHASDAGTTVYNTSLPATPIGFDGFGNPDGYTNNPLYSYPITFSTMDSEGKTGTGIGNLPSNTTVIGKNTPIEYTPEQSSTTDKLFNPRALVIYQDTTKEDPSDPVMINRQYFSLENTEIVRDGNLLHNSSLDSPTNMGSFVSRHYNERTGMMTHYYRDSTVNRWIISSTPYTPSADSGNLSFMVFPTKPGLQHVYKWYPFYGRRLI